MSRFLTILTLTIFYITLVLGKATVNTPTGSIAKCATISVSYSEDTQPPPAPITLDVVAKATSNRTPVSKGLDAKATSVQWTVNVPAGDYFFAINDGTGENASGTFTVIEPSPNCVPSGGAPSGAPSSGAPSGAPSSGAPSGTSPSTPSGTSPSAPSGAPSSSTGNTPTNGSPQTTPTKPSTSSPPPQSSSSRTSFSLYNLVLSLIVVAGAMVHLA